VEIDDESRVQAVREPLGDLGGAIRQSGCLGNEIGRDRLISIAHSHGGGNAMGMGGLGVVTVWYWSEAGSP
jgi:hypothetical protein